LPGDVDEFAVVPVIPRQEGHFQRKNPGPPEARQWH
jgi:hypothetical protein